MRKFTLLLLMCSFGLIAFPGGQALATPIFYDSFETPSYDNVNDWSLDGLDGWVSSKCAGTWRPGDYSYLGGSPDGDNAAFIHGSGS